jgi:dUTP pyrophosphatase
MMKQTPILKLKALRDTAKLPTYGSEYAACFDIYAAGDVKLKPRGDSVLVPTGFAVQVPYGWQLELLPRSGLATKQGLRLSNCVGIIDADYRGEVFVALYNDSTAYRRVKAGERIAQARLTPVHDVTFQLVDELDETERGDGGFGSTGTL